MQKWIYNFSINKIEWVQITNKQNKTINNQKQKNIYHQIISILLNNSKKDWHKRLDINDDDIIFKKLMNPIIHLFQIFDSRRVKMI